MCPGIEAPAEQRWNEWLGDLLPWERHWLMSSFRELDWHDDFVEGRVSLDELSGLLTKHFDTYSIRV